MRPEGHVGPISGDRPLKSLGGLLSVRTRNILVRAGFRSVDDVRRAYRESPVRLLMVENLGQTSYNEIRVVLIPKPEEEIWPVVARDREAIEIEIAAAKQRLTRLFMQLAAAEAAEAADIERELLRKVKTT